jgi:hypothetical protein
MENNADFIFDDAGSVKPCHRERRIKFSKKVEDFFEEAEKRNIDISPLVNMLVENSIPLFTNRGYTWDGIEKVYRERCRKRF